MLFHWATIVWVIYDVNVWGNLIQWKPIVHLHSQLTYGKAHSACKLRLVLYKKLAFILLFVPVPYKLLYHCWLIFHSCKIYLYHSFSFITHQHTINFAVTANDHWDRSKTISMGGNKKVHNPHCDVPAITFHKGKNQCKHNQYKTSYLINT